MRYALFSMTLLSGFLFGCNPSALQNIPAAANSPEPTSYDLVLASASGALTFDSLPVKYGIVNGPIHVRGAMDANGTYVFLLTGTACQSILDPSLNLFLSESGQTAIQNATASPYGCANTSTPPQSEIPFNCGGATGWYPSETTRTATLFQGNGYSLECHANITWSDGKPVRLDLTNLFETRNGSGQYLSATYQYSWQVQ